MKFLYLERSWPIFNFGQCFSKKSAFLRFGHVYDVIVTANVECLYLLWNVCKEKIPILIMVQIIRRMWVGSVFKFTGVLNTSR